MQTNLNLARLAQVLNVHLRTVVRLVKETEEFNADSPNLTASLPKIARVFNADPKIIMAAYNKKDRLITPTEAARILRMPARTIRHYRNNGRKEFDPHVSAGQTVRYSEANVKELRGVLGLD